MNLRKNIEHTRTDVDHELEKILVESNKRLRDYEMELIANKKKSSQPILIIAFAPRSGSTLLSQLMAYSGNFNYVSNFMARFWEAPYVAGLLEKSLKIRETIPVTLTSSYGVTHSLSDPHEFGFFWNKWFAYSKSTHKVKEIIGDKKIFRQEFNSLLSLISKPFFIKNSIIGINSKLISSELNNVYYVVLKRNPLFTAQSIYKGRLNYCQDPNVFWALKPSTFNEIRSLDWPDQIALQIRDIYRDIYRELNETKTPYIDIDYDNVCDSPESVLYQISSLINIKFDYSTLHNIKPKNNNRRSVDKSIFKKLERAIQNNGVT